MARQQNGAEPETRVLQTSKDPLRTDATVYLHDGGVSREEVVERAGELYPGATVEYVADSAEFHASGRGDEPLTYPAVKITRD